MNSAFKRFCLRLKKRVETFINHTPNAWNKLPDKIVESELVEVFKSNLDKYLS